MKTLLEKPVDKNEPIPDATILSNGEYFNFNTTIPTTCHTRDQVRAVMMCRFQRELDAFLDRAMVNEREAIGE